MLTAMTTCAVGGGEVDRQSDAVYDDYLGGLMLTTLTCRVCAVRETQVEPESVCIGKDASNSGRYCTDNCASSFSYTINTFPATRHS